MSYNKINGTPWHVGPLRKKDERRHKSRCKYHKQGNSCGYFGKCIGSARCEYYREKILEEQNRNTEEIFKKNKDHDEKNSLEEANDKNNKKLNRKYFIEGDSFLLLNVDSGELLNYKIVSKANESKSYLKIVCEDPLANKVIRNKVGKRIRVYENKSLMTYEIMKINLE